MLLSEVCLTAEYPMLLLLVGNLGRHLHTCGFQAGTIGSSVQRWLHFSETWRWVPKENSGKLKRLEAAAAATFLRLFWGLFGQRCHLLDQRWLMQPGGQMALHLDQWPWDHMRWPCDWTADNEEILKSASVYIYWVVILSLNLPQPYEFSTIYISFNQWTNRGQRVGNSSGRAGGQT